MVDSLPYYTIEEVAEHTTQESGVWIAIEGNVYDVTQFLEEHPGGEEILLENAGKDATTAFQDVGHSSDAIELRKKYLIGRLSEEARRPVLKKNFYIPSASRAASAIFVPALVVAALAIAGYVLYRHFRK